jgi:hypothetical protein
MSFSDDHLYSPIWGLYRFVIFSWPRPSIFLYFSMGDSNRAWYDLTCWIHPSSPLTHSHGAFARPKKHLNSDYSVSLVDTSLGFFCVLRATLHQSAVRSPVRVSLCLDDLVYPSFFGCLAIYDLAVPSSPNRSPPFVKFNVGTTQACPLMR